MEHVDFMHLVRLSEQACEQDAKAYRRSVWWFAVLGYAVVILLALAALGVLVAIGLAYAARGFRGWMVWSGIASLALLWVSARALMTRFEPPEGYRLQPDDAPELFKALERLRRAVKGPPIDVVMIDAAFNASIMQRPRFGLFGHTNYLTIGWPMLCALEPKRLLAVIAHEYGHLRGEHGKFSAWVYRTRTAWWRMYTTYEDDDSPVSWLLRRFFVWYIPRFNARTFALARQDEYEADRIAARICSAEVVGQAWNEIEIKSRWYDAEYWRRVWRRAAKQEQPEPMPHAEMVQCLLEPPPEPFAREALRQAMQQLPSYDDTHPVPKDRLAALGVRAEVPDWSRKPALMLLGPAARQVAEHFDRAWWDEMKRDWTRHREHLATCRTRIRALKERAPALSADEWVEWAECFESLSADDPSPFYRRALQRDPRHAGALHRLAERGAQAGDAAALHLLEQLQAAHPHHGYAACSMALELLDRLQHTGRDVSAQDRRTWRERRERFEQTEQQAWEAFSGTNPCADTCAPCWSDADRKQVVDELIRTPDVAAAWVVGKRVATLPGRDYLVLFVRLKRLDEALGREVVHHLMHRLPFGGRLLVTVVDLYVREADMHAASAVAIYQRQR